MVSQVIEQQKDDLPKTIDNKIVVNPFLEEEEEKKPTEDAIYEALDLQKAA